MSMGKSRILGDRIGRCGEGQKTMEMQETEAECRRDRADIGESQEFGRAGRRLGGWRCWECEHRMLR